MDGERLVTQHSDKLASEAGTVQGWDRSSVVAGSRPEEEEAGMGQIQFQCLDQQVMVK